MTDVSKIKILAEAISSKSPAIRAYAIASARINVTQEADIRMLIKEVELLKGSGSTPRPPTPPTPPPPPPPPPPGIYGASLDAAAPRIGASPGGSVTVSSFSALASALGSVSNGTTIYLDTSIDGGGSLWTPTRNAAAGAPITIARTNPGVLIQNFSQWDVRGSYLRFLGLDIGHNTIDAIKFDAGAHDCEVDGGKYHHSGKMGFNIQDPATNIQFWNAESFTNGSQSNGNLDHGLYWGRSLGTKNVIANCLFYDNCAYNIQIYPNSPGVIVTCCTLDGGQVHAGGRGGMVVGSEAGLTDNVKIYGLLSTNAPTFAVTVYNPTGGDSGNAVMDALGFGNSSGDFQAGTGMTYTNATHNDPNYVNRGARNYRLNAGSFAIGKVQAARYGWIPALDKDGIARVTADAGCYAA